MKKTPTCPMCHSGDSLAPISVDGGADEAYFCEECSNLVHTRAPVVTAPRRIPRPAATVRGELPGPSDADAGRVAEVEAVKIQFLARPRDSGSKVAGYLEGYQQVFSSVGLAACAPGVLKDFANSNIGCNPGNMSVFNSAWNELGEREAAERVREVIDYLLRGEGLDLEDRFSALVNGSASVEMKGFKEALLTRVLWVDDPGRFVPLLTYTGNAGKKEIARSIWGLRLPDPDSVDWSLGRLSV
ncbi:hypothetical protein [Dietzia sp. UBA5065]|nr:hypothetical protein [Dietzia sp. UBA5065]